MKPVLVLHQMASDLEDILQTTSDPHLVRIFHQSAEMDSIEAASLEKARKMAAHYSSFDENAAVIIEPLT